MNFIVRVDNYDADSGKLLNGETLAIFAYQQDAKSFVKARVEDQILSTYRFAGVSVSLADADRGEIVVNYGNFRTRTTYTVTQDLR